jgi:hypothetical protein
MSIDQILGLVDGNPKAKRKEMRDSVSLGFLCLQLSTCVFLSEYCNFILQYWEP